MMIEDGGIAAMAGKGDKHCDAPGDSDWAGRSSYRRTIAITKNELLTPETRTEAQEAQRNE